MPTAGLAVEQKEEVPREKFHQHGVCPSKKDMKPSCSLQRSCLCLPCSSDGYACAWLLALRLCTCLLVARIDLSLERRACPLLGRLPLFALAELVSRLNVHVPSSWIGQRVAYARVLLHTHTPPSHALRARQFVSASPGSTTKLAQDADTGAHPHTLPLPSHPRTTTGRICLPACLA